MCVHFYAKLIFILLIKEFNSLNNNGTLYRFLNISATEFVSGKTFTAGNNNDNINYCIEPGFEKVCSGHGSCRDGFCICDSLKFNDNETESLYEYSGKYCEECPYCKGQRCDKLLPCVEHILWNSTSNVQCFIYYNIVEHDISLNYNDKLCEIENSKGCMMKFKYFYDVNNNLFVDVDETVNCLGGRKYIVISWCIFTIYVIVLMFIMKRI